MHRPYISTCSLAALAAMLPCAALADGAKSSLPADTDPISEYLADLSPGPIAANDMIGVSASAVTMLSAPKDFTAALEGLTSSNNTAAFGLAFTPARTRYAPVSVEDYTSQWYTRLWAGTTFSYAQNTLTQDSVDYHRQAAALHVSFFLRSGDDPAVIAYRAFSACAPMRKMALDEAVRINAWAAQHVDDPALVAKGPPPRTPDEQKAFLDQIGAAHDACLPGVQADTKVSWNASQVGLTISESWIRGPGGPRFTLGKSASVALAYGFGSSLVNVTVRRVADSMDVTTIAATPTFSNSTLAGLRYTYKPATTKGLFALAEVSNAKGSSAGQPNETFKSALGVDYRLRDGVWLQFRVGKNHVSDGTSLQTATLFGIKLSPSSTLPLD